MAGRFARLAASFLNPLGISSFFQLFLSSSGPRSHPAILRVLDPHGGEVLRLSTWNDADAWVAAEAIEALLGQA